ncbi:type II toxin-antitoxin system death-on-curing family toxin [Haladaptatus sp. R4]|uniref:type II toxin-antitoxin system death-on-curing family toxin n=1 Tax=Haladaptatus sp. R4 TaxID=1679489 RepID=UPI0008241EBA|nr:type II toxin-antitoxin system death-on-curing family toxin [Haladaptatus sp. R4]
MNDGENDFWYPSVEDIRILHDEIVEEDEDSEPGIKDPDRISSAVDYIQHGHFGQVPETIHEKAFHLMRLITANHWFVDGNKRTALNTVEMFYLFNGYELDTDDHLRSILKEFAIREDDVDQDEVIRYLIERTENTQFDWDEITVGQFIATIIIAKVIESYRENPDAYQPFIDRKHTSEEAEDEESDQNC